MQILQKIEKFFSDLYGLFRIFWLRTIMNQFFFKNCSQYSAFFDCTKVFCTCDFLSKIFEILARNTNFFCEFFRTFVIFLVRSFRKTQKKRFLYILCLFVRIRTETFFFGSETLLCNFLQTVFVLSRNVFRQFFVFRNLFVQYFM